MAANTPPSCHPEQGSSWRVTVAFAALTIVRRLLVLWSDGAMTDPTGTRVVRASRDIAASAERVFDLIADPAEQPGWDGNDNLAKAPAGQRVRGVGDVFTMTITGGQVRENHVVEFEENRCIAWRPAEPGQDTPGHLWRWELDAIGPSRTRVTHTYDWSRLTDESRIPWAKATTADHLQNSLARLAALAERL